MTYSVDHGDMELNTDHVTAGAPDDGMNDDTVDVSRLSYIQSKR